jgi:ZIP family zinc transporter
MVIILSFLTFISTFLGGLVGLRYKDKLHLILGFTAGVLLGVVAFDIFPELIELLGKTGTQSVVAMGALVAGFLIFHILEKLLIIHHAQEEEYGKHRHPSVGVLSALALSGHSFLDGVGIGLGFQVSNSVGLVVALAVISHDFSDGLNTVSLMLAHKNTTSRARLMLLVDAHFRGLPNPHPEFGEMIPHDPQADPIRIPGINTPPGIRIVSVENNATGIRTAKIPGIKIVKVEPMNSTTARSPIRIIESK